MFQGTVAALEQSLATLLTYSAFLFFEVLIELKLSVVTEDNLWKKKGDVLSASLRHIYRKDNVDRGLDKKFPRWSNKPNCCDWQEMAISRSSLTLAPILCSVRTLRIFGGG